MGEDASPRTAKSRGKESKTKWILCSSEGGSTGHGSLSVSSFYLKHRVKASKLSFLLVTLKSS